MPGNLRQMVTEEHHFFGPDVVKALIGWFDLHLKEEGDGEAVASLPFWDPLPEDEVMVYSRGNRPAEVISIPEYLKIREQEVLDKAEFDPEQLREILKLEDVSVLANSCKMSVAGVMGYEPRKRRRPAFSAAAISP